MPAAPEILLPYTDAKPRVTFTHAELDRIEQRLERISKALDSAFVIPGVGIRFGADSILGLIPGIGDVIGLGLSGWLILEAKRLEASPVTLARMAANVAVDAAIGAVPLAGDVFDLFFKANRRNFALVREHIAELRSRTPKHGGTVTRRS